MNATRHNAGTCAAIKTNRPISNSSGHRYHFGISQGMDLRHARTFVTVADLGSVSKAALRLRIAQPALSRHISDLERDLGFKLFDRVGRRLLLTGEGEQLLSDCRGLLGYARALDERAQLLRRGDTGVLRMAASPQFIESVISDFLHRYAQRYPNVQVKVIEAISWSDTLAMLERGEIHLGQNSASRGSARRSALHEPSAGGGRPACCQQCATRQEWSDRDCSPGGPSATCAGYQLRISPYIRRHLPVGKRRNQHRLREPDTAYAIGDGRTRTRCSDCSLCGANRSVSTTHRPSDLPKQTGPRTLGHLLGQAAPLAVLRYDLLCNACGIRSRSIPNFASVRAKDRRIGEKGRPRRTA